MQDSKILGGAKFTLWMPTVALNDWEHIYY